MSNSVGIRDDVRMNRDAQIGLAADLDLLIGRHSQFTHSIGAALAVFVIAAIALRHRPHWLSLALGVGAAYLSHVLLDWLGQDATPPLGITALWPFGQAYYISHIDVFWGISREPWRPGAFWHDVLSVAREVIVLLPCAVAAYWLRRPRGRQVLPRRRGTGERKLPGATPAAGGGESRGRP